MANTFDTSRVGGGTYELAQDANGNYNLKSVGFNQVNKLNLPDLKDSNTSVADTTKKATEDTIKTQTTEVFKPSNVYQGGDGGGGQSYQTMADSKFAKEAKDASVKQAAQPMTKIDTGKTTGKFLASGAAGSASLLGDKTSDKFLTSGAAGGAGISNTYKSPTMAMKENEFAQGQYTGLKPVQSAVQNTVGNVIDSVKNNKAVQMAGSVLGFAMNPIMGGVRMVAGMLPKDSPQNTFDRGYFPTNDSGRIGTDPATNVFGGMNAVSAFGNVSQGAQKRIDTRNKTSTKLSGAKKKTLMQKQKNLKLKKKLMMIREIILFQIKAIQELQQREKLIQEDRMPTL